MLNGKIKKCEQCGNEYTLRKRTEKPFQFRKRRFCSNACKMKWLASFNTGKKAHNNKQTESVCKQCGKITMRPPCLLNRPFCGVKCMGRWMSGKQRGKAHWNWQGGKLKRNCIVCGKEFEFDKGELKRSKNSRIFCSQSCKAKYCSIKERNPNWKGGIQPEHLRIRNSKEAKEWKRAVLERDNHTCQKCEAIESLHIHHLKLFSKFKEDRFDIKNGLTLCAKCHYELHSKLQGQEN